MSSPIVERNPASGVKLLVQSKRTLASNRYKVSN